LGDVMVPVPEELVASVGVFLNRKAAQPASPASDLPKSDDDSLARSIQALDEPCRKLLFLVGDAALNERVLTISDVAALLGWNEREVLGAMFQANYFLRVRGAAHLAMVTLVGPESPPAGDSLYDRVLAMPEQVARRVASIEQDDRDDPDRGPPS